MTIGRPFDLEACRQRIMQRQGTFLPSQVKPRGIRTVDTVQRHLKRFGYAVAAGDGVWKLTKEGWAWIEGEERRGEERSDEVAVQHN